MDPIKQKLSCDEIRQLDTVSFLFSLGYEPSRIRGNDYWYLSPLRTENTASFKVNRYLNRWYDHGIGQGGNLVDFCLLYYQCSVSELLAKYGTDFSFHQQPFRPLTPAEKDSKITMLNDLPLNSSALLQYLQSRCIEPEIAVQYCREVHYQIGGKTFYAIGFKNDLGGYELRNSFFKGSSSPKGITSIKAAVSTETISVFEGFFDFLSYLTCLSKTVSNGDFLILNSLAFFETSRKVMDTYQQVNLFLDHDRAGQNCSADALRLHKRYQNKSSLYTGSKDLNQWLVNRHYKEKPG